jgi:hypothetical protein
VALLAIHDGLASLRAGMPLADLMTAILVGVSVWRLTGLRAVAVVTALLSPLLPISLHEHAQFTPETLAAPLLLAGAVLCARRGRAVAGGGLLALAVMCKLAFALPALAIALSTRQRREAVLTLILAWVVFAIAAVAAFGIDVWREAVHAQSQVGRASLHYAGGLITQGGWNELPLMVPAAAAGWLVWTAGPGSVDLAVDLARSGPPRRAYSRDPYYAFLSDRRMPGNQPDLFMLEYAPIDASFARRAAADQPRWP